MAAIGGQSVKSVEKDRYEDEFAALDAEREEQFDPAEMSLYNAEFSDGELAEDGYNELSDEELSALEAIHNVAPQEGMDYEEYREEIEAVIDADRRGERETESSLPGIEGEGAEGILQPAPESASQAIPAEEVATLPRT